MRTATAASTTSAESIRALRPRGALPDHRPVSCIDGAANMSTSANVDGLSRVWETPLAARCDSIAACQRRTEATPSLRASAADNFTRCGKPTSAATSMKRCSSSTCCRLLPSARNAISIPPSARRTPSRSSNSLTTSSRGSGPPRLSTRTSRALVAFRTSARGGSLRPQSAAATRRATRPAAPAIQQHALARDVSASAQPQSVESVQSGLQPRHLFNLLLLLSRLTSRYLHLHGLSRTLRGARRNHQITPTFVS